MPEFHAEPCVSLAGLSHKSALIAWGAFYAGSKIRSGTPSRMDEAHTVSWAPTCHFLLVTIDGSSMTVRAIGEDDHGELRDVERFDPAGGRISGPMVVG